MSHGAGTVLVLEAGGKGGWGGGLAVAPGPPGCSGPGRCHWGDEFGSRGWEGGERRLPPVASWERWDGPSLIKMSFFFQYYYFLLRKLQSHQGENLEADPKNR